MKTVGEESSQPTRTEAPADTAKPSPDSEAAKGRWSQWLASDWKGYVALIGVLVYGVVRVAHESFYTEFQVSPEEVGLSQTVILGRALLFLVFFLSVAIGIVALGAAISLQVLAAVRTRVIDRTSTAAGGALGLSPHTHPNDRADIPLFLWTGFAFVASLPVLFAFFAPGLLEFFVWDHPNNLRTSVIAWTCAMLALGVSALWYSCPGWATTMGGYRWSATSLFAHTLLALPLLVVVAIVLGSEANDNLRLSDTADSVVYHGIIVWTLLSGFIALSSLVTGRPRRSMTLVHLFWWAFILALVVPLALVYLSPERAASVVPAGDDLLGPGTLSERYPLAGTMLWLLPWLGVVAVLAYSAWRSSPCSTAPLPHRRSVSALTGIVAAAAIVSGCTLSLASARGEDLADTAGRGDRLRFGLLLTTAEPTCLTTEKPIVDSAGPYIYLGKSASTLVLYEVPHPDATAARNDRTIRLPEAGTLLRFINDDVDSRESWESAARICREFQERTRQRATTTLTTASTAVP